MITEMKAGHLKDIDKPSEPFEVIGKIIPRYENENWTFTELLYEAPYLKSYQDEEDEEDEWQICCELKHMPGAGCIVIERFSMNNTTREEVVKEMERIIIEGRL